MIIFSAKNLSVEFGAETLFKNVSFEVDKQDKIGLVGVNGSGKTSLFKVIIGQLESETGNIAKASDVKIGYMEQHVVRDSHVTVYNETLSIFSDLLELEKQLEQIHSDIDAGNVSDEILHRQMLLQTRFEQLDGFTFRARTASALLGLGFSRDEQSKPVNVLSGGEKSKIQLAKLLLSGAGLLLLDEPTNHLDIKACEWLEKFLLDYKGAYVVISHDRYFLDKVTAKTLEMDNQSLATYKGNYTKYRQLRKEQREFLQKQYDETCAEIQRIEGIIAQQKRFNQAHNYVTIASKQKQIDRLAATLVKPSAEPEVLRFSFQCFEGSGNDVLLAENLSKSFGEQPLFKDVNLDIKRQERVFLLGRNGCGKTTLFKILTGELKPDTGFIKLGARIKVGYFDQVQTGLSPEKSVIDEVWDMYPKMSQTEVRTALGSFLFHGDDVFKLISTLSGGEKARVALLKLMLSGCNLLLLDEPTNHLDITSKEALENAFAHYTGTLIVISHDRYLINKLATKLYLLNENGAEMIEGNYDTVAERFSAASIAAPTDAPDLNNETGSVSSEENITENTNTAASAAEQPNKLSYKEQKERESALRRLRGKLSRTEEQIAALEADIAAKNQLLTTPDVVADYVRLADITAEIAQLNQNLSDLMWQWEDVAEQLEQFEG